MDANQYQVQTRSTAIYPKDCGLDYCIHGLTNEAGEVAGAYKKFLRGDYDFTELQERLSKELGDVMWYVARVADEAGFDLAYIMQANVKKLQARKDAGTIAGDGDNR